MNRPPRMRLHPFLTYPTKPAEVLLGVVMLGWGIIVWLPMPYFAGAPSTRIIASLGSEFAWGISVSALGLMQLLGVWRTHPSWRLLAAYGGSAFFPFLAATYLLSNWGSPAWWVYACLGATAWWVAYRRTGDYRWR